MQAAAKAYASIGRYDGTPPTQQDFQAAYAPEQADQNWQAFQHQQKLGSQVDLVKALTPTDQDALLAAHTPAGTGPDFAGQRDQHAVLAEAIASNRQARADDRHGYVTALHPQIGKLWDKAANDPQALSQAITATNTAMDQLGMPAEQRQILPKAMVSKAVAAFGDTTKPAADRIAPIGDAITAAKDPATRLSIFMQAAQAGLPRLLAPGLAALANGWPDAAKRLLRAVTDAPSTPDRASNQESDTTSGVVSSPVALDSTEVPAGQPARLNDATIDLAPAVQAQLARLDGGAIGSFDGHPLTGLLRSRMTEQNFLENGNDYPAANALASDDLRRLGGVSLAQALPKTTIDVPPDQGAVVRNPTGPQIAPPRTPTNVNTPPAPNPEPGNLPPPANENTPGAPAFRPGVPSELPPSSLKPSGWGGRILGLTLAVEAGKLIGDYLWPKPDKAEEPYAGTRIPQSYHLGDQVYNKVYVPKQITKYFATPDAISNLPDDLKQKFSYDQMLNFNFAIFDARRQLELDRKTGSYHPFYTAEDTNGDKFDISFDPKLGPDGEATIVAMRPSEKRFTWAQHAFGYKDSPAGAWQGTPATLASASPAEANNSNDDTAPKPTLLPPAHSSDDRFDIADFHAGIAAGLTDQAALAMAKQNYRSKAAIIHEKDTAENAATAFQLPPEIAPSDLQDLNKQGSFKRAYLYKKDPTKIVLVPHDEGFPSETTSEREWRLRSYQKDVDDEMGYIKQLSALGFPTVKIHGSTKVNGVPALIMDHIDGVSSKDITEPNTPADRLKALKYTNENTITDLNKIRGMLDENKIYISDIQFMIDKNGHVAINDPIDVSSSQGISRDNENYIEDLIYLISKARAR